MHLVPHYERGTKVKPVGATGFEPVTSAFRVCAGVVLGVVPGLNRRAGFVEGQTESCLGRLRIQLPTTCANWLSSAAAERCGGVDESGAFELG
jgi:hypothetical protein